MLLSVDGGCSRIFSSCTSQWARRRRFLALMVGAPGSSAPTPLGGLPSTFLSVDGGHSRIFSSGTSWGPAIGARIAHAPELISRGSDIDVS
jgi:hypothetical protein